MAQAGFAVLIRPAAEADAVSRCRRLVRRRRWRYPDAHFRNTPVSPANPADVSQDEIRTRQSRPFSPRPESIDWGHSRNLL